MRYFWLNKNNNKLILFMNGWAMNESAVNHLDYKGFDILTVCDYREFDVEINKFDFSKYEKKYLVGWSMGVYVSNLFFNTLENFDKKIAISGTNKIIDDKFGIPQRIYDYTIKNFNSESKEKFLKNIFLNEKKEITINHTTEELQDELISIKNIKFENSIKYDKAIISKRDVVVPYKNQLNFWKKENTETVEIDAPHYVFNNFKSWQDIIC